MTYRNKDTELKTISLVHNGKVLTFDLEWIGQGSSAVVYRAVSKRQTNGTTDVYAIKVSDLGGDWHTEAELVNYVALQKLGLKFNWEHVTSLAAIQNGSGYANPDSKIKNQKRHFLIMEYCNAGDCTQWIKNFLADKDDKGNVTSRTLTGNEDIMRYLKRICVAAKHCLLALREFHANNHIHGDIAFRNMFVQSIVDKDLGYQVKVMLGDLDQMQKTESEADMIDEVVVLINLLDTDMKERINLKKFNSKSGKKLHEELTAIFSQFVTDETVANASKTSTSALYIEQILSELAKVFPVQSPFNPGPY